MRRVYAIDIPMLINVDVNNASTLLESLQSIIDHKGALLLMDIEALFSLLFDNESADSDVVWRITKMLTDVETCVYDDSIFSEYIIHQPTMTDVLFPDPINYAIKKQVCAMHLRLDEDKSLFLVLNNRWPKGVEKLDTTKDRKTKHYSALVVDQEPLSEWLQDRRPQYIQGRHFSGSYPSTMGEVSGFDAWDNKDYAQLLLDQAYADTPSDEEYPKYLYTYDDRHHKFVQFRNDRNKQYHGMNIAPEDENIVPVEVRNLYHK